MNTEDKNITLGILGGLGPMATVYFYEMLTSHTYARCDQDHIDMIISSRASTPDRTAFVLGESCLNPLDFMLEDAKKLVSAGADIISIPCNTAHYFYDALSEQISIPIINIIKETVSHIKRSGAEKIGVLATAGTVKSGAYEQMCAREGLLYCVPKEKHQEMLSDIIYGSIKQGKRADMERFFEICDDLRKEGCDRIVLGCTELSLIKRSEGLDDFFVDSLEVLALKTITMCKKTPVGFSEYLTDNLVSKGIFT